MSPAPSNPAATGLVESPAQSVGAGTGALGDAAARGTGVTLVTQGARIVLQFGSVVLLTRLLGAEAFGLLAMVTAVVVVAEIVRDFGLSAAAVQARTLSDGERTNLFWANTGIGLLLSLAGVAAAPLLVMLYGEPRVQPIMFGLAGVFLINGLATQFLAELARSLRFRALAAVDLTAQLCAAVVAAAIAVTTGSYWALVAQQVTVATLTLALAVVASRWWPGLPHRGDSVLRFLRFGGALAGTSVLSTIAQNVDKVGIGVVFGAAPLGIYNRAYQLLLMPITAIAAPLTRVAVPVLSRLQDERDRLASALARTQLFACYVTGTLFLFLGGLADSVVHVLFGPGWEQAAPVFALLAVGGAFRAMTQVSHWLFVSLGLTGSQFRLYLITQPLLCALTLAGLPWGLRGVAAGHSLGYAIAWVAALWWAGRVSGIAMRPFYGNASRALLVVAVPVGLLALGADLLVTSALLAILAGLAATIAWVGLVTLAVPPVRRDLAVLLAFARRALNRPVRAPARSAHP